nr:hypothetical protein [Tanacetum cinerariifolium]
MSENEDKYHDTVIDLESRAKKNEDVLLKIEKVEEHLITEEIEKLVEGTENVENVKVDNSINHSQNDLGTRLDPGSYKESLKIKKIDVVSQPVNVIKEEDELAEDDYELKRREIGRM